MLAVRPGPESMINTGFADKPVYNNVNGEASHILL